MEQSARKTEVYILAFPRDDCVSTGRYLLSPQYIARSQWHSRYMLTYFRASRPRASRDPDESENPR